MVTHYLKPSHKDFYKPTMKSTDACGAICNYVFTTNTVSPDLTTPILSMVYKASAMCFNLMFKKHTILNWHSFWPQHHFPWITFCFFF